MDSIVTAALAVLGVYLLVGLLFAIPFAFRGVKAIDPAAADGTWGFKLLIIPGAMVFWPILLKRWMAGSPPPEECSAHRKAAKN